MAATADTPCPRCGGVERLEGLGLRDEKNSEPSHRLSLWVEARPSALVFKGGREFPVRAAVCRSCGGVEFYVEDPEALFTHAGAGETRNLGELSLGLAPGDGDEPG